LIVAGLSLKELLLSGGRDLELLVEVLQEPVTVGLAVKVVMIDAFDIDAGRLARNARNMRKGNFVRASLVLGCCEHGDRNLLNRLEANKRRLVRTLKPLIIKLLEALDCAVHAPVLLRLNRSSLKPSHARVVVTELLRKVITEGLQVSRPVGTVVGVDAVLFLDLHGSLRNALNGITGRLLERVEAGS